MINQIHLYTGIHKGQRNYLSQLSKQAGTLDVNDVNAVDDLVSSFEELKGEFKGHAALEEQYIHPLLYDRIPEGARELEEDHKVQHQKLEDLGDHLSRLRHRPEEFERRRELALEFYRGFNRFIALYLVHINKEEEIIQPALWILCTDAELGTAFGSIVKAMKPDEFMLNLSIMFPAMNIDERIVLFNGIKRSVPPEILKKVSDLAKNVLQPKDWEDLAKRVELG